MLGPACSGTAWAPFAGAVGISNPLPVCGAAVGPGVSVLPTLLGSASPPSTAESPEAKQERRELGRAAADCGEDCRQKTLPTAGEHLGRCVCYHRAMALVKYRSGL